MTETKLFPGVTQKQIDNSKAEKLKAAKKQEEKIKKIKRANSDIKIQTIKNLLDSFGSAALIAPMSTVGVGLLAAVFFGSSINTSEIETEDINEIRRPITVTETSWDIDIGFNSDTFISGYSYEYAKNHNLLFSFYANLLLTSIMFLFIASLGIKFTVEMLKDRLIAADILAKTDLSFKEIEKAIKKSNKNAILEIIEKLSEQDRKFFDEFIADPNNITKQELAIAVVKGHLMTHPNDLDKLITAFNPESIPQEIRELYEKHKKSKTISWEQAVFQYKNQGEQK